MLKTNYLVCNIEKGFQGCWDAENTPKRFHIAFTPSEKGEIEAIFGKF